MNNQISPAQLIQFVRNSSNPSQVVLNMMEERVGQNPIYKNILQLAKNNKSNEIEQIVRNMFNERGLNFDEEFNSFKQMFNSFK